MTRTPAPALSAEESEIVARFDAAPVPAEVLEAHLESVRAAMADDCCPQSGLDSSTSWCCTTR